MNDSFSEVIYRDDNPSGARTLWLRLEHGKLYMEEQDVSPQLEQIFGRDTFERFIGNVAMNSLKIALNVVTDRQVIETLKNRFGTNSGMADFKSFLDVNRVTYKCGSY